MDYKVSIKKLPKSQVRLDISIPYSKFEKFLDKAAAAYSGKKPIAGFRPGKAPRSKVEEVIGKEKLIEEATEMAVRESYATALIDHKIEAIDSPKIELKEVKPEMLEKALKEGLKYEATVPVFPQIELPDLNSLKVKKPDLSKIEVSQKEVNKTIDNIRKMRAKLITVNRAADKGDRVEVDFKLSLGGVPFEGGSSTNHPLVIGENKFIPGFEENLIGLKRDETKKFELAFPADYHNEQIKGKKGEFEVKMKLVQEQQLPSKNDEFAQSAGNFKNFKELQEQIKNNLKQEKKYTTINKSLDDLFGEIIKNSKADLPDVIIEEEKKKMLSELEGRVATMGLDMDSYLKQIKKSREDLLKGWNDQASDRIKISLALRKIAETQKIEAAGEEIEQKVDTLKESLKHQAPSGEKTLDEAYIKNYAKNLIVNEKTIEWLKKKYF